MRQTGWVRRSSTDFATFWAGQAVSNLGSAFTSFALPLLVYQATRSSVALAITSAASFLPWPLFGLVLGVWTDRVDRKRVMLVTDVLRAAMLASIPLFAAANMLAIWWIYVVAFVSATLSVAFTLAQIAAVPSLVGHDDLVAANGRIQASYSVAAIVGPALAGLLVTWIALPALLYIDALSFLFSAGSLVLVRTSFNESQVKRPARLRRDLVEGLRYVLRQPVVRAIAVFAAIANFLMPTVRAQLALYGDQRFHVTATELSWLYAAGPAGALAFSVIAGRIGRWLPFGRIILGSSLLYGLGILAMAVTPWLWLALLFLALSSGLLMLFNITQGSLRQQIVPNELLGRVGSAVNVIAQSSAPVGAVAGGFLIAATHNVAFVYGAIGLTMCASSVLFSFSALGKAERPR